MSDADWAAASPVKPSFFGWPATEKETDEPTIAASMPAPSGEFSMTIRRGRPPGTNELKLISINLYRAGASETLVRLEGRTAGERSFAWLSNRHFYATWWGERHLELIVCNLAPDSRDPILIAPVP